MTTDLSTTKPVVEPRWATNGGTRVAPSAGQMDTGWNDGQRPPFNVMNWLQGVIYDWQQYLDDSIDELDSDKLSRHGLNQFDGNLLPSTNLARKIGDSTHKLLELWTSLCQVSGNLEGTCPEVNLDAAVAHFDTIGGALGAIALDVDTDVLPTASGKDLGSSSKRWDAFLQSADNSGDSKALTFSPTSSPASTTAKKDELSKVNLPKAWGNIQITGTHAASMLDGFNVTSVSADDFPTLGMVLVTFAQDFVDTKYVVIATHAINTGSPGACFVSVLEQQSGLGAPKEKTAGTVMLELKKDDGTSVDFSSLGTDKINLHFIAFGRQ